MGKFKIQNGPVVLFCLDLESDSVAFHEEACQRDGLLVLDETEKVSFLLEPSPLGQEIRVSIGDVSLVDLVSSVDDAGGRDFAGTLVWPRIPYFESARGRTAITFESRPEDSGVDVWGKIVTVELFILPSKLGEERYDQMKLDLQEVSRSLLIDLYGKSKQTHDLRYAKEGGAHASREQELASIIDVVRVLSELLLEIAKRPASRIKTEPRFQKYWGDKRISPVASQGNVSKRNFSSTF